MKTNLRTVIGVAALTLCSAFSAQANGPIGGAANRQAQYPSFEESSYRSHPSEVVGVIKAYEAALNGGKASAVLPLFTEDGVFMAPNSPTAVGSEQVEAAFGGVFAAISPNLRFKIGDIQFVARNWAVVRSTSSGTITINANGAQVPSAFQELFVLKRSRSGWKIARYSFSSTLPANN